MTNSIPCSKSYAQRYILVALFSKCKATFSNIYKDNISDDVMSALNLLDVLELKYTFNDGTLEFDARNIDFESRFNNSFMFNCGESGTLTRILIPILTNYIGEDYFLFGEGSLMNRKIDSIIGFLNDSNIKYIFNNGKLPVSLYVKNPIYKDELWLDGSNTSQYISGIIIASCLKNMNRVIHISNCSSLDYIKITIDVLKHFGYNVNINENNDVHIRETKIGNIINVNIENDWSCAAAYIAYHVAMGKEYIYLDNMNANSLQCDKKILDLVSNWYDIHINSDKIELVRKKHLYEFDFDCSTCPDLFPVVCAIASTITGYSSISGLDKLVNKESNRGQVIYEEFKEYGINTYIENNTIYISYANGIKEVKFNSHNDHRISMALLILRKYNGLDIPTEDKCLSKSYPKFIDIL